MKTKKSIFNYITILILLLTVIFSGSTVWAQTDSVDISTLDHSDPTIYAANIYAHYYNISKTEALERFKLQNVIGKLDNDLSINEPETFAGLWIEHSPYKVVIQCTTDGSNIIKPYLSSELSGLIEVRIVKRSLKELQQLQLDLLKQINALGLDVSTSINVKTNQIEIRTVNIDQTESMLSFDKFSIPDYVKIIEVPSLPTPCTTVYGGLTMWNPNSAFTSGFAVVTYGGTRGIASAAHCDNTVWINPYGGTPQTTHFQSENKTYYYDVQWHTVDVNVTNLIQYFSDGSTTSMTSVTPRDTQPIGAYVAKYGRTTGFTMGQIDSKNNTVPQVQYCMPTFIHVANTLGYPNGICQEGDSGGPFYWDHSAWGICTNKDYIGGGFYMAANYILSGLNVNVLTTP